MRTLVPAAEARGGGADEPPRAALRAAGRVPLPGGDREGRRGGPRGGLPDRGRLHALPDGGACSTRCTCTRRTCRSSCSRGGSLGLAGGWALQYWASVIEYPMNIGGRPLNSWPAFIVPTFETTVLGAAFATVFGMLLLNGFPQPYHPVFNVKSFAHAPAATASSCASSRATRSSTRRRPASCCEGSGRPRSRRSRPLMRRAGVRPRRALAAGRGAASRLPLVALRGAACRQDMHDQPKYRPLRGSELLRRQALGAPARRGHRGPRHAARGRGLLHGQDGGRLRRPRSR